MYGILWLLSSSSAHYYKDKKRSRWIKIENIKNRIYHDLSIFNGALMQFLNSHSKRELLNTYNITVSPFSMLLPYLCNTGISWINKPQNGHLVPFWFICTVAGVSLYHDNQRKLMHLSTLKHTLYIDRLIRRELCSWSRSLTNFSFCKLKNKNWNKYFKGYYMVASQRCKTKILVHVELNRINRYSAKTKWLQSIKSEQCRSIIIT